MISILAAGFPAVSRPPVPHWPVGQAQPFPWNCTATMPEFIFPVYKNAVSFHIVLLCKKLLPSCQMQVWMSLEVENIFKTFMVNAHYEKNGREFQKLFFFCIKLNLFNFLFYELLEVLSYRRRRPCNDAIFLWTSFLISVWGWEFGRECASPRTIGCYVILVRCLLGLFQSC